MMNNNLHLNDESVIRKLKKGDGNAKAQVLSFSLFMLKKENGKNAWKEPRLRARIHEIDIQVTPMSRPYIGENVSLQTVIGTRRIYKRGTHDIVLIDAGSAAGRDDFKPQVSKIFRTEFFIIPLGEGKIDAVHHVADKFISYTRLRRNGNYIDYEEKDILAPLGSVSEFREGVIRFGGRNGCSINSSSQGRKFQMAFYRNNTEEDVKKFYDTLNQAVSGEYGCREGEMLAAKGTADANTRISSKTTGVELSKWEGCEVNTVVFLFDKDDDLDGSADLGSLCVAKAYCHKLGLPEKDIPHYAGLLKGYLIQCRPYTCKVAAYVADQDFIEERLGSLGVKLYTYDPVSAPDEDVDKEIHMMMNKQKRDRKKLRKLSGFDGVKICLAGTDAPIDLVCDPNGMKDEYEITDEDGQPNRDGINVLNVSHFDEHDSEGWEKAHTSAQIWKTVIRAVIEYQGKDREAYQDLFEEAVMKIIRKSFGKDLAWEPVIRYPHMEAVEDTYITGFLKDVNPSGLKEYPSMLRNAVNDVVRTLTNRILLDRYDIPGHAAMITSDLVYRLTGKKVLGIRDGAFEVYDPVFNRYQETFGIDDERGLMEKFPAMGTLEMGKLIFISDSEMEARIRDLELPEKAQRIAVSAIRTFKEGGLLIPAELSVIARVCAGLDEDGDKGTILFPQEDSKGLAELVWNAGFTPRSVEIVPDGVADESLSPYGKTSFMENMSAMIALPNQSVGVITNSFRVLVEGLLLMDPSEEDREWFQGLFREVFSMAGSGRDYEHQYETYTDEEGFLVCRTHGSMVTDVEKEIQASGCTWENIRRALDDLDILGRHCQELTIDAQKKYYEVAVPFIEKMREAGFNIVPLSAGIEFAMNWDDPEKSAEIRTKSKWGIRYVLDEGEAGLEMDPATAACVRSDAFGKFRLRAITEAYKLLSEKRKEYFILANDRKKQQKLQDEYCEAENYLMADEDGAKIRIDAALEIAKHCDHIYREYESELRKSCGFDEEEEGREKDEMRRQIRAASREAYGSMMAEIDNEIRCAAGSVPASLLISYLSKGREVTGGYLGKLLVPETMKYIAEHAERPYAYEKAHLSPQEEKKVLSALFLYVKGGHLLCDGKEVRGSIPDIPDGPCGAVREDGQLYLVRPLADYIRVPEPDYGKAILNVQLARCLSRDEETGKWGVHTEAEKRNQESNKAVIGRFSEIPYGEEIEVRKVPVEGKHGIYDFCIFAGGENLGAIHIPSGTFSFFRKRYDGMRGKLSSQWNTKDYASMFISLEDVTTSSVSRPDRDTQEKPEPFLLDADEVPDDSLSLF